MRYFVTVGSQTLDVEVDGNRVLVGGKPLEAHLAAVTATPLYHLLLGGASWTVAAQSLDQPGRWALDVVDERTRHLTGVTGAHSTPVGGTVRAPMPGLVVRVEVREGQRVEVGAGLVVVEAMKMENELRATRPGVVATVHVQVGQAVEKGTPLVTLASPEPSG